MFNRTNRTKKAKPSTRVVISVITNAVIAVVAAFINPQSDIKINIVLVIVLVVFCAIEALFSYIIGNSDSNDRRKIDAFRTLNKELSRQMCKEAEGLNGIAKGIINYGTISKERWTFERESMEICYRLYKYLLDRIGKDAVVEVLYVKRDDNDTDIVCTIGYANGTNCCPHNFREKRNIRAGDAYKDASMFRDNSSKAFYRLTAREVDNVLYYRDREKESGRYEQCLLLPVMCEQTKMVGLLEIFLLRGTVIAKDDNEMKQLIADIGIFTSLFLLLQKTDKAACAIPIV